jgi:ectoine hydroxylase-related dioxygenase (phytanoyl-CoA dioxygenase family)
MSNLTDGLRIRLFAATEAEEAAVVFHRDGFVAIRDALTAEQLAFAQQGAERVMAQQVAEAGLENMNRGYARHSFGDQIRHPEWAMLVDLPTTLPVLEAIWNSQAFSCMGAGGDYSLPGAKIQRLHSDIGEFIHDPYGQVTTRDLPAPFIVINFLMVAFTRENGAIRFVPGTQRSRAPIPDLESEPDWMRNSILCAPAGTALVRDVRCWHGGTANQSNQARPMTSVGYHAPWYRAREAKVLPRARYETLSPRAQELCRLLVAD